MNPRITHRVRRTSGDDWQFAFAASGSSGGAFDLTGYTPGGVLYTTGTPLEVSGAMVDMSTLSLGKFTLTIPRDVTANLPPDETTYRLQVYLIDSNGLQRTYCVVPVTVEAA